MRNYPRHNSLPTQYTRKCITIKSIEGDDSSFNMCLQITSSYSMLGVRFVVGLSTQQKIILTCTDANSAPWLAEEVLEVVQCKYTTTTL